MKTACQLLVFADDWGRHPSSCQHLIRQLLPQWPTTWVNTIGTRKPRLDRATLQRGWEKVRSWTTRKNDMPEDTPENLTVLSPRMWPYFTRRHDRWLNRRLLERALAPRLSAGKETIAITTLPLVADLVGRLPVERWVYYCVDDFSVWPGLDGQTLARMEAELVPRVDVAIAASEVLQSRLRTLGKESSLLTHGVDLAHWQRADAPTAPLWPELPRPWAVFWGLLDRRLDVAWLAALAERWEKGTILLVGPQQDVDPRVAKLPRVALRPAMPFDELPRLAASASALIMPYADLPVTRAMQPLKLLEYLATGRPVIARRLPAVAAWDDALDACDDAAAFAARVMQRVEGPLPAEQQAARARLAGESWQAKARQLTEWIVVR